MQPIATEPSLIHQKTEDKVSDEYLTMKARLKAELIEMLEFDTEVADYSSCLEPIAYLDANGHAREYTPDGIIRFRDKSHCLRPVLFDVHHRAQYRAYHHVYGPQIRAAKKMASSRYWWQYLVFTEREIHIPFLENARFLKQYLTREVDAGLVTRVLETLRILGQSDVSLLLCALCRTKEMRVAYVPAIWQLVASGVIECNLNLPLSMQTVLRMSGVPYVAK